MYATSARLTRFCSAGLLRTSATHSAHDAKPISAHSQNAQRQL